MNDDGESFTCSDLWPAGEIIESFYRSSTTRAPDGHTLRGWTNGLLPGQTLLMTDADGKYVLYVEEQDARHSPWIKLSKSKELLITVENGIEACWTRETLAGAFTIPVMYPNIVFLVSEFGTLPTWRTLTIKTTKAVSITYRNRSNAELTETCASDCACEAKPGEVTLSESQEEDVSSWGCVTETGSSVSLTLSEDTTCDITWSEDEED